ncbi:hypothetical protein FPV67DRAFT_1453090 [Lyophyllum atratum]|nr:hypothetical protein FPV67DRAFT_1453090 [Lyophyllum atratum]
MGRFAQTRIPLVVDAVVRPTPQPMTPPPTPLHPRPPFHPTNAFFRTPCTQRWADSHNCKSLLSSLPQETHRAGILDRSDEATARPSRSCHGASLETVGLLEGIGLISLGGTGAKHALGRSASFAGGSGFGGAGEGKGKGEVKLDDTAEYTEG